VEKKTYEICFEVLRRLEKADILRRLILVGSWCLLFYERYFDGAYHSMIRTRDIDFLIPIPARLTGKTDLPEILKDLGFVVLHKGREGYITLQHPELIIEFLVPERGRGHDGPFPVPALGINAQPLRYLDFLASNTIKIMHDDIEVSLPHPACFALHKLIIGGRRRDKGKSQKDTAQALSILRALIDKGSSGEISKVWRSLPAKWQSAIKKQVAGTGERDLIALFSKK
jgi:hypothetical protein